MDVAFNIYNVYTAIYIAIHNTPQYMKLCTTLELTQHRIYERTTTITHNNRNDLSNTFCIVNSH